MSRLEGKRVAITGAAGGIGTPVARMLHEAGAWVIGIDRTECTACDSSIVTDLSDDTQLAALAERLSGECPDVLVNIAGVMRFGLHEDQPIEALALCYRVNLLVPAVLARAVAAPMRARGSGQIVNIGSVLGSIPYPWFAAYSSSKAGLAALSQGLRRELMGSGVAVTHINPRAARTAFNNSEVNRFLEVTGMKADAPEWVAARIVAAIEGRRETVSIGLMERIYAALNAISPKLIDNGLATQIRKARAEFC
ncbi:SDR family NAD(P)-dependent oxidoreductase [Novosphingobium album (ex Hu et al. 2023)]|uniref:SDR family NAD(P)-dependent oxidoreductase n=1 Tax=Novosphingobium album (ex Hu et al. 2023) TaxID=2930093 RepID=A0ABT0B055_9SPHN|nr:SDR family NAD(P)-dependent oxidoreductase [Novosphingobium album (ex Hu et al. 2023)]MCJ2178290.1 SDR family NAD(P)-dependent oxidoreductase [Novosphingobium album (ex Hu et al. 2023)]